MASTAHAIHKGAWAQTPTVASEVEPLRTLVELARTEYMEMPGLSLSVGQAAKLWNLPLSASEGVLGELLRDGFLARTTRGQYIRA
jgi:hypothetical protein